MNTIVIEPEYRNMVLAFLAVVTFFVGLYALRSVKIYFYGRRIKGEIAKVIVKDAAFECTPGKELAYQVKYTDPLTGLETCAVERSSLPFREFKVGQKVVVFVDGNRIEILSATRFIATSFVMIVIVGCILAVYMNIFSDK